MKTRIIITTKRTFFEDTSVANEDCFHLYHGIYKRFGTYEQYHADDIKRPEHRPLCIILNTKSRMLIKQPSISLVVPADLASTNQALPKDAWVAVSLEREYTAAFDNPEFLGDFMPEMAAGRAKSWILQNASQPKERRATQLELLCKVSRTDLGTSDRFAKVRYIDGAGDAEELDINVEHLQVDGVTRFGSIYAFTEQRFAGLAPALPDPFFVISKVSIDI